MLFDLGDVSGRAMARLKSANVADRCVLREGSFFETILAGADAYHFKHILHDWNDAQCGQILGHCRKVIPSHGKLLISECVVSAGNDASPAKNLDMSMLNFLGGKERTEAEFQSLSGSECVRNPIDRSDNVNGSRHRGATSLRQPARRHERSQPRHRILLNLCRQEWRGDDLMSIRCR